MTSTRFLSYNIGSSSSLSGLLQLLNEFTPIVAFIQEISITTDQLNTLLVSHYIGQCNNESCQPCKPGTAFVWLRSLEVSVTNLVPNRIQTLSLGNYNFINIYAPSGTQGQRARKQLFMKY